MENSNFKVNIIFAVINDSVEGLVERELEEEEVVRRYVELEQRRRFLEEENVYHLGCNLPPEESDALHQQPQYHHIRLAHQLLTESWR